MRHLDDDLDAALRRHVSLGPGGSWNDDATSRFEQFWQEYRAGLGEVAAEFDRVAASLPSTADQVDGFNRTLVATMIEIGSWIALTIATIWVPVAGEAEAAAAIVEGSAPPDGRGQPAPVGGRLRRGR